MSDVKFHSVEARLKLSGRAYRDDLLNVLAKLGGEHYAARP